MQFGILTRIFLVIHLNLIGNFWKKIPVCTLCTKCTTWIIFSQNCQLNSSVWSGSYINLEDKQLFFQILILYPSFAFYIYICNFYLSNGRLTESPPTVCTQQCFKSIYLCIMLWVTFVEQAKEWLWWCK